MSANPDMLLWFSKPEKAMQKRMNEKVGQHEQRHKVMREKIEDLRDKFEIYQSEM
jgi:Skp family chaperone for outer membrane proteins